LVFISMNSDELLNRTAQYQIQYSQSRHPVGRHRRDAEDRRNTERDGRALAPIISIRHNEDGTTVTRARVRARRLHNLGRDDDDDDNSNGNNNHETRTAQIPREFATALPPFRITTECSNDENESTPNRIGSLPFESDSSEDGNPFTSDDYFDDLTGQGSMNPERQRMTLFEAWEASQMATQEAVRAVGGELMQPHAKFNIEKDKSICTIRFEPPVSGRFILLKMWSPQPEPLSNIDIQGVIARGFAGPRYFPSMELR
jgi:hypothetical protein